LAALCKAAYASTVEDVGRVTAIPLPGEACPAAATLLHFREAHAPPGVTGDAAAGGPQQYGLWRVKGLGLVLAFRGTATRHDALVDAALAPARLGVKHGNEEEAGGDENGASPDALYAHHGFLMGARRHADDIVRLIARFNGKAWGGGSGSDAASAPPAPATRGPVWLTGHSLGGGYATTLALDLLARRDGSAARLFGPGNSAGGPLGGGGVVTFGAPMVLVGPPLVPTSTSKSGAGSRRRGASRPALAPRPGAVRSMHARLAALEATHASSLREAGAAPPLPRLTWAAFVNGADLVPRALGSPLGGVTAALGATLPVLAPAQALAARYRPVGSVLLIVGPSVRVAGVAPAPGGGLGSAATSDDAAGHLHAGRAWTALAAGSAAVKAESAHDLASYTAGLMAGGGSQSRLSAPPPTRRTRRRSADGAASPTRPPAGGPPLDMDVLQTAATDLGRALGEASSAAAARLRDAAARAAASTWRAAAAAAVIAVGAHRFEAGVAGLGVGAAAAPASGRKRSWLGRKGLGEGREQSSYH